MFEARGKHAKLRPESRVKKAYNDKEQRYGNDGARRNKVYNVSERDGHHETRCCRGLKQAGLAAPRALK